MTYLTMAFFCLPNKRRQPAFVQLFFLLSSSHLEIPTDMTTNMTMTPLEAETRTVVDTATAAFHLNRKPQTLRVWACNEGGPIRPIHVNGRLAWPVAALRSLLGCSPASNDKQFIHRA